MKKIYWLYIGLFVLTSLGQLQAQSLKMKIANNEFEHLRYADAIIHYEQILKKDKNNLEAKTKLAECYRKTENHVKAMNLYGQLVYEETATPKTYWYYAQSLTANGRYGEAITWYEKYEQTMPNDLYAGRFVKAYKDMSKFHKDSSDYHIQYVPSINSWQSDFSPVYYKKGLMFLSNRQQQQIIRRVYELDQTSFLDYFFYPDTALIYSELQRPATTFSVNKDHHNHDDYTIHTSNDNATVGEYGHLYRYDSIQYHNEDPDHVTRMNKSVNNRFHEGPATFSKNEDTVFFTRNVDKEKIKGSKPVSHFDLFIASIKNGQWESEKEVPFNGKNFSTGHPAFTPDYKKLYFASDRPGGKGGVDIYVVDYNNGQFSEPVNVEAINTPDDEMFPFVDAAGTLYFATDGLPGLGGLDIFKAKMREGKIVSIENMGTPFNSHMDDFGIIWNKDMLKGFFSSNRKRGVTDDDIYAIEKLCRSTVAYVYDSITHQPLDSAVVEVNGIKTYTDNTGRAEFCMKATEHTFLVGKGEYENSSLTSSDQTVNIMMRPLKFEVSGKVFSPEDKSAIEGVRVVITNMEDGATEESTTGSDGRYRFPLDRNSSYTVTISRRLCGTNSIEITTRGLKRSQTIKGDIEMLCQGDIVVIENIYYDLNKANIRKDAALELDKTVALMNKYPDMRIELRSHTDSRASSEFNMRLSASRAQAVVEYMATQGVVDYRMRAKGYGETLPVNRCKDGVKCSEEEFQQNRRTEFKVLNIN